MTYCWRWHVKSPAKRSKRLFVWRLQTDDGVGAYGWLAGPDVRGVRLEHRRDEGPPPWEDFPLEECKGRCLDALVCGSCDCRPVDTECKRAWQERRALCGFPSRAAAARWFNLAGCAEQGYKLVRREAQKVWMGRSRTQVLFIPKSEAK